MVAVVVGANVSFKLMEAPPASPLHAPVKGAWIAHWSKVTPTGVVNVSPTDAAVMVLELLTACTV